MPLVQVKDNDVFFSLHAALLTLITLFQMGLYTKWGKACPHITDTGAQQVVLGKAMGP